MISKLLLPGIEGILLHFLELQEPMRDLTCLLSPRRRGCTVLFVGQGGSGRGIEADLHCDQGGLQKWPTTSA